MMAEMIKRGRRVDVVMTEPPYPRDCLLIQVIEGIAGLHLCAAVYSRRHADNVGLMATLFLFNGPPGGGKSTAVQILRKAYPDRLAFLPQFTTRAAREDDPYPDHVRNLDASAFAHKALGEDFWWYNNPEQPKDTAVGSKYGFSSNELRSLLGKYPLVVMLLSNHRTIELIKSVFTDARIVPLFVYRDARQRQAVTFGDTQRDARVVEIMRQYNENPFLYQHCFLNVTSAAVLEDHVLRFARQTIQL